MQQLFGIIDCNNFYVSCERVFQPALEGKPVVVLSNNDGNITARSNEARQVGITIGMPFFKAKRLIEAHNVEWLSSNYALYGDMSRRVMDTIHQFVPATEHYSIDEDFVHFEAGRQDEDAHQIKQTVRKWTASLSLSASARRRFWRRWLTRLLNVARNLVAWLTCRAPMAITI